MEKSTWLHYSQSAGSSPVKARRRQALNDRLSRYFCSNLYEVINMSNRRNLLPRPDLGTRTAAAWRPRGAEPLCVLNMLSSVGAVGTQHPGSHTVFTPVSKCECLKVRCWVWATWLWFSNWGCSFKTVVFLCKYRKVLVWRRILAKLPPAL